MTQMPDWMEEYFQWHAKQLSQLNETNWNEYKFLVSRCLTIDGKCGGTADRIRMIPMGLMAAYRMKRIFFIEWTKPCRLEEFLLPVRLNWTVPEFIHFEHKKHPHIETAKRMDKFLKSNATLVDMRFQSYDHGSAYYNYHKQPYEPEFYQIYRVTWQNVFQLTPAVQNELDLQMKTLGLIANEYVSVHVRSRYIKDQASNTNVMKNALNCVSHLSPGSKIFVSADSNQMTQYAMEYGQTKPNTTIVARRTDEKNATTEPLHMDRGNQFVSKKDANWADFPPSAYYNVFVDLFILAQSKCLAYGKGGFGRWGLTLTKNPSCYTDHLKNKQCQWHDQTITIPIINTTTTTTRI